VVHFQFFLNKFFFFFPAKFILEIFGQVIRKRDKPSHSFLIERNSNLFHEHIPKQKPLERFNHISRDEQLGQVQMPQIAVIAHTSKKAHIPLFGDIVIFADFQFLQKVDFGESGSNRHEP
jgi:hypothetical protein